ncbi:acyltransferase [Actinoplanes lobatus]|uniref:Acyltransferase n=1 Tax=Actinoplanes lobatus TaxID=113568 RepID=A0A7W7HMM4_9ACTN|nr:acyltransferase [Actinoplanes lobatus]MBB4753339.1 peptidoglycan/LPS O-acetylase OafA/YrhL [Actinoplanes lobatus]GGN59699.1 acyltransferase [Actinoplanes lobatus]GIE37874.1 acyltransferase [Actinoplanes lobatus]
MTLSRSKTRDRTIDALRAVAILGVVIGHWLVSAVVSDPARPAAWHGASPLAAFPALTPATWVLQTLGLFFFAGGFAAARSRREPATHSRREPAVGSRREPAARSRPGLAARFARLARPIGLLAAVWLPAWLLLRVTGAPDSTLHVVRSLLVHPLWFLLVYLVLTVSAPLLRAAVGRYRLWPLAPAIALVAACDVARHLETAAWLHPAATVAGWAVPYLLGIALADGLLPQRAGRILALMGVAAGAGLVLLAGYPASAVGVPGDGWSNLDPPSLFALALAAAQIGVFLLVRDRLAGWLRRPAVGTPVAVLNRSAMTVYCWHQSALLLVTFGGLLAGPLPGLSGPPTGMWPLYRLLWLPVFAVTLVFLCAAFQRAERVRTWRRTPR